MSDRRKRALAALNSMRPSPAAPTRATPQAAVPFIGLAAVGLVSGLLPPYEGVRLVEVVLVAAGFAVCLGFLVVAVRRSERTWVDPMPAFVFFGVFALARDASGEASSGLEPLIVLPILWLALTGSRRDLAVSVVLTAAVFLLPVVLIGAPDYPVGDWRRTLLWTAVAAFIAPVVQRLVAELARQRKLHQEASAEMAAILRGARLTSIVGYDLDGTIRSFSAGAEELHGARAADVIGACGPELFHDCEEVAAAARELGVEPGFAVFRTLAETRAPSRVWTHVRADGEHRLVQLVLTELRDYRGHRSGYLAVAIDVTAEVRAERELAEAEGRWRTLLDHLPDTTVLMLDTDLTICAVGGQAAVRHGLREEATGMALQDFSSPENLELLQPLLAEAMAGRDGQVELRAPTDDSEQEVLVTRLPDGVEGGRLLVVSRDVSRDRARSREVEAARRRAERLFADAPHGVAVLRPDGSVVRVNHAMEQLLGIASGDLVGRALAEFSDADSDRFEEHLAEVLGLSPALVRTDWTLRDRDGAAVHVVVSSRVLRDDDGGEDLVLVNVVDVSEHRRYEERLAHLAAHDPLTGLANRRRFDAELRRHWEWCARYGTRGALLVLDLDQFKEVNDSLGHGAGDQLIVSTASLLRHSIRSTDLVARLGGDEFAVLLSDGGREAAEGLGQLIVERIREHAMTLDGIPQRVTASVGGVTFEDAERTGSEILSLADMVMYDAKEDGRDRCVVFDGSRYSQPRMGARLEWKHRIARALERDEFVLHLQPIRDLASDRVQSAEALLRLADSEELVPPSRFLYVAERAGLGPEIDRWVVRHAVPILAQLRRHDPDFALEVNLSGHSIGDPGLEQAIVEALAHHDVDPSGLILEITETAAVADVEVARGFAERMTALGCKFALDDFGAGFGSFYYLKHLLFDYVKIDGEFVAHCHTSTVDRTILRSIVGIANGLGKQTVAEFVSEEAILDVVRAEGVDLAQGFLIGKPMPVEDLVASLDRSARERTEVGP